MWRIEGRRVEITVDQYNHLFMNHAYFAPIVYFTVTGSRDLALSKTHKNPCAQEAYILRGSQSVNITNKEIV